jgi:hypothetical protein
MRLVNQFESLSLNLARGELLSCVEPKTSLQVSCLSGVLWITSEGETRDLILKAGDAAVLPRGGLVIVQALDPALVHIADAAVLKEA